MPGVSGLKRKCMNGAEALQLMDELPDEEEDADLMSLDEKFLSDDSSGDSDYQPSDGESTEDGNVLYELREDVEVEHECENNEEVEVSGETISWKQVPVDYEPQEIQFTGDSGLTDPTLIDVNMLPLSIFLQFVTDDIIMLMVSETNRYAKDFF